MPQARPETWFNALMRKSLNAVDGHTPESVRLNRYVTDLIQAAQTEMGYMRLCALIERAQRIRAAVGKPPWDARETL